MFKLLCKLIVGLAIGAVIWFLFIIAIRFIFVILLPALFIGCTALLFLMFFNNTSNGQHEEHVFVDEDK